MKKLFIFLLSIIMTIQFMSINVLGVYSSDFVLDSVGLLREGEVNTLTEEIVDISSNYNCGVYILTVDSYKKYTELDFKNYLVGIYRRLALGVGEEENGILLALSTKEKQYEVIIYGSYARKVFTEYAQKLLEDEFLDNLGESDWYGGFKDYVSKSREILSLAKNGELIEMPFIYKTFVKNRNNIIIVSVIFGYLISLIVCMGLRRLKYKEEGIFSRGGLKGTIALTKEDFKEELIETKVENKPLRVSKRS